MKSNHAEAILAEVVQTFVKVRKDKGMSHETLATKAGVTRPAISHIENGKRKPSLLVCLKIADALGLKLWEVIKDSER